ncbi:ribosomal L7Ae/L30e/S12e/Gadd45 family protein [Proteinivorax hydrogeniformans]|uniref:Ribosomal L7Ae/L30e/S12e/Gadd45 family protein n=1 Tax=Proteinivorax hydrogeniformans TaxID=1826727 RepID=A0AAU8HU17_9FIRM
MTLDDLSTAKSRVVGFKQTKLALESGEAKTVYVAKDAEKHVTDPILQLCKHRGAKLCFVDSMIMLGKSCGIQVRAATAAIIEE